MEYFIQYVPEVPVTLVIEVSLLFFSFYKIIKIKQYEKTLKQTVQSLDERLQRLEAGKLH